MGSRGRWLRWLAILLTLTLGAGFLMTVLAGRFLPPAFVWSGACVLAAGLTFLLVRPPNEE